VIGAFWHVIVPLSVARHGYFAGRRIRAVDDLPHGVVAQWKRWCSHPDLSSVKAKPCGRPMTA
jgi:predicted alpha/beta hydrolase